MNIFKRRTRKTAAELAAEREEKLSRAIATALVKFTYELEAISDKYNMPLDETYAAAIASLTIWAGQYEKAVK